MTGRPIRQRQTVSNVVAKLAEMEEASRRATEQAMAHRRGGGSGGSTGRQRWEALQREGYKAHLEKTTPAKPRKVGPGRPKKTRADQLPVLIDMLEKYTAQVASGELGMAANIRARGDILELKLKLQVSGVLPDDLKSLVEIILAK